MKTISTKSHKVPLTVLVSNFPVFYICVLFSPWLCNCTSIVCGSSPVKNCCTEELYFLMNDKLQFWDAQPQTYRYPCILSNTFRHYCLLGHVIWRPFLGHSSLSPLLTFIHSTWLPYRFPRIPSSPLSLLMWYTAQVYSNEFQWSESLISQWHCNIYLQFTYFLKLSESFVHLLPMVLI